MKRVGISFAMVLMCASAASAADMPVKARPSPAAVVAYNWTGLYVGAHVGYGWGKTESLRINGTVAFPAGTRSTFKYDGLIAGGQIGFNYQVAPNWVWGVEGDVSWSDIDGDSRSVSPVNASVLTTQTEVNWLATATARVGYAANNWLWYFKGGAAWAEFEGSARGVSAGGVLGTVASGSETRSGWIIGGGVEHGWSNWSAKLEYNYLDFGTDRVYRHLSVNNIGAPDPAVRDNDSHIHVLKFGVNYRFSWGGPVATTY